MQRFVISGCAILLAGATLFVVAFSKKIAEAPISLSAGLEYPIVCPVNISTESESAGFYVKLDAQGEFSFWGKGIEYVGEFWSGVSRISREEGGSYQYVRDSCLLYTSPSPRDRG